LIVTLIVALGTAIWALFDLMEAQIGYLRVVRFHGMLELAAAALIWVEGWGRFGSSGDISRGGSRAMPV
jgi:hypothetical protein